MRTLRAWIHRVRGVFAASAADDEFARELESHLQMHVDDCLHAGMRPDEARRAARLALGGVEATKDAYRDRRGLPMIETVIRDIRYGARVLRKSPGFSLAAVLILGLGIGSNTAIFSVVNAVVLRPLPFGDPARIMRVWHTPPREQFSGQPIFAVSPANYLDWRSQNHVFERMAAYGQRRFNLTGQGQPDAVDVAVVTGDFFGILDVKPIAGRLIEPEDEQPGREHVLVLNETWWQTRFGGAHDVVGRQVMLSGTPYTIIGVLPRRFAFPETVQAWAPLVWTAQERAVRGNHNYASIAQLKSGVDVRQAQAELTTISKRLEQQYPADDKGWGALVLPLHDDLVGDVRTPLLVLLGAVAFVLLIACANLANLLLAKTIGRSKEIAVRTALGAGRRRIIQQLLVESVLLAVAGGAAGLAAAAVGTTAIVDAIGASLPRATEITVDGRVLAFTAALAILTGLVSGVAPAWRLTKGDVGESLKQGLGRGGSQAGERRVRSALVISEVALALVLLVGAGLLIRTLGQLRAVDPGIDPRNVLTMTVAIPRTKYVTPGQQVQFFDRALQNVRAVPGVAAASAIDSLPLDGGGSTQPVAIEGRPVLPLSEQREVAVRDITPGYLASVRLRLVAGRDFSTADTADRNAVVLVSESMVRQFWPNGENPLGRHVTLGLIDNTPREVVGIVGDVKMSGLDVRDPVAAVYTPFAQNPSFWMSMVVRSTVPPNSVAQAVIGAIHAVDPEQPVLEVRTMDEVIGASLGQQRFAMTLLSAFAALALVLAAVGIYSVLSYSVRQRVREIGIRMALGAPPGGVVRMVVVEGMKPTLVGLAIGVVAALVLGRVLATLIFGVTARDLATYAAVSAVILVVGLLASIVPAYRATRIDPLQALRTE